MKINCISSVYGKTFHHMSAAWYDRNSQYLPKETRFHLVSLDGMNNKSLVTLINYSYAQTENDKLLGWGDGDLPRLKKVIKFCANEFICVHMDLDVALFKLITPILELEYDFIISRAFAFPKTTAEKIGFVGCTGFYIAKPKSSPLLNEWINWMESKSQVDQQALNEMFESLSWATINLSLNGVEYIHAVSSWNEVSILVLDSDVLPRRMENQSKEAYGVHNPKVVEEFWRVEDTKVNKN